MNRNSNRSNIIRSDVTKKRKVTSQNIQIRLFNRENGLSNNFGQFYQCITPNLTIVNVKMPPPSTCLTKFTPDGRNLIAFDQTSLTVYKFNGTPAAGDLLNSFKSEIVHSYNDGIAFKIRNSIFDKLFTLKYSINVSTSTTGKHLARESRLFTKDSHFVIIGAVQRIPQESRPNPNEIYTTNEGISPPSSVYQLQNQTFYLIDLDKGFVSDYIDFNADHIFLSYGNGIYLYDNTFAVLSIIDQTIHIYEIFNGKFLPLQKIGRFCSTMEQDLYQTIYSYTRYQPQEEATFNSLKHRILTFMFKKADGDSNELKKFYQFFDNYRNLRMWKMQLLDENHLLIKYLSKEVLSCYKPEPYNDPAFFVFYNIPNSKIIQIYDNISEELLTIFEKFSHIFHNAPKNAYLLQKECQPILKAYLLQKKCKQTTISAHGSGKEGKDIEAAKRILAQLPIRCQKFNYSPYLDTDLFSYNNSYISMETQIGCIAHNQHIRFFDPDTGLFKFRLYPGKQNRTYSLDSYKDIEYIFHPYEPFAISIHAEEGYFNFHIRNASTIQPKFNKK